MLLIIPIYVAKDAFVCNIDGILVVKKYRNVSLRQVNSRPIHGIKKVKSAPRPRCNTLTTCWVIHH